MRHALALRTTPTYWRARNSRSRSSAEPLNSRAKPPNPYKERVDQAADHRLKKLLFVLEAEIDRALGDTGEA